MWYSRKQGCGSKATAPAPNMHGYANSQVFFFYLGWNWSIHANSGWFRSKQAPESLIWPNSSQNGPWNRLPPCCQPPFFCFIWPWEREREREREEKKREEVELRRGEKEEKRFRWEVMTKEYKLSRWESQLFHIGGLGNWKRSKGTFLECGSLFTITKNIGFIKNKS